MKLINLIFILFLAIPFVHADDVLMKTNITLNAISWIENNESRMNITILTENIEGNKNLVFNSIHETFNQFFNIWATKSISCANTTGGKLDSYFYECDGGVCRDRYIECRESKKVVETYKQDCDTKLANSNSEKNSVNSNLTECNNKFLNTNTNLESCETDKDDLKNKLKNKIDWYIPAGIFIIAFIWYYIKHIKGKGRKGEEEKRGIDYSGENKEKAYEEALKGCEL